MKVRIGICAALAAVAAMLAIHAAPARADDIPAPKIAVCDPVKVLAEIQEGKDIMTQTKADADNLQAQLKQKQDDLQSQQDKLKLIVVTSKQYQDDYDKFIEDNAAAQGWLQAQKAILARKQRAQYQQIFDKVLKTIKDVAQDKGCNLVLNSSQPLFPDIDHMDIMSFYQTIWMHSSLYADPKLDITQDVIIAMDKSYTTSPPPTTNP